MATDDPAKVKALVGQVQQRFAQTIPYIWLSHTERTIVANTKVVNLARWTLPDGSRGVDFIQGSVPLYQVWLKP
jgi:ABC-type transport system substrate-binding protein